MKVQLVRDVAEWSRETWEVEIPDGTPESELAGAALDAMYCGQGEIVTDEGMGYVESIDHEVISTTILPN